jgi:hypothetical protein
MHKDTNLLYLQGVQKLDVECQTDETRNESTQTIATQSEKVTDLISNRVSNY